MKVCEMDKKYKLPVAICVTLHEPHDKLNLFVNEVNNQIKFLTKKKSENLLLFKCIKECNDYIKNMYEVYGYETFIFQPIALCALT